MKWIVLLLFAIVCGLWTSFLRSGRNRQSIVWTGFLIGFLPFVLEPWHLIISPYATPMWIGYVKGWQVSLIDILAIAVLFAFSGSRFSTPLKWPFLVYVASTIFALPFAPFFNLALSYPIQLARMALVLFAVARIASSEYGARAVLAGLIAGLTLQFGLAFAATARGALQSGGSFGHQNLLGYVTHPIMLASLGLLLGGRWSRLTAWGFVISIATVILTASRATIFVAGLGIVLTLFSSSVIRWTNRKSTFVFAALLMMIAAVPLAQYSLSRRLSVQHNQLFGEDGERAAFERASWLMIRDHPFGIGPNHYAYVANTGGYSSRVGVNWSVGSRSTNVHNSFLLVNAETGYVGLLAFLAFFASTTFLCFRYARRYSRHGYSELFAGFGCALVAIAVHSKFEWMFVTYQAQYVLMAMLGLVAGCVRQSQRAASYLRRSKLKDFDNELDTRIPSNPPINESSSGALLADH